MAYGFPALLDKSGGCGTRCAQTVLAEPPPDSSALLGMATGDLKSKPANHHRHSEQSETVEVFTANLNR